MPVIIIGGGGHGAVVYDTLLRAGRRVLGVLDPAIATGTEIFPGIACLGGDEVLAAHPPEGVELANGIGSTGDVTVRRRVFERFTARGYRFATLIHPSAVLGFGITFGEGAQIMAGTVIQPRTAIGLNAIVNTGSVVDHDCVIGDHAHIAPAAVLSGGVQVGEGGHVGTGAHIVQGLHVGAGALVGAGVTVLADIPAGHKIPAWKNAIWSRKSL